MFCVFPLQRCGKELRCVELQCPLQSISGTAIELRARLWNSTFIEASPWATKTHAVSLRLFVTWFHISGQWSPPQDYASLSHLEIVVRASLVLHSTAKNMVLGTPDTDVSSSRCDLHSKLEVATQYVVICNSRISSLLVRCKEFNVISWPHVICGFVLNCIFHSFFVSAVETF